MARFSFEAIRTLPTKIKDGYFDLQVNQRRYINAFVMLFAYLVFSQTGLSIYQGFLPLFFVYWIWAISSDFLALYKKICESVVWKVFIVVLISFCTNFAIVYSSQITNDVVGVDPGKFPHTIAFLSILSVPILIFIGIQVLNIILALLIPLLLMFHVFPDDKFKKIVFPGYSDQPTIPFKTVTLVIQLGSFVILAALIFNALQKGQHSYETFLRDAARAFIYQLEMYPKSPCEVEQDSRVAFLSDEKILVGVKSQSGITFKTRNCKTSGL